ncbi:MAG: hypothetical protein AB1Z98_21535 [Nannocystaceae bacterium]
MPSRDPPCIRVGLRQYLLVPARDVLEISDRERATRLLDDGSLDPERAKALVDAVLDGSCVAVRLDGSPRPLDAPEIRPLIDPRDPTSDDPRPTWISVQVVHAAGLSTEGIEIHLSAADGREHYGRLGADGHWRSDAVPRGACTFTLLDHPTLRARPRIIGSGSVPDGQDVWEVGKTRKLQLAAAAHHRVVVTSPRQLCFSA